MKLNELKNRLREVVPAHIQIIDLSLLDMPGYTTEDLPPDTLYVDVGPFRHQWTLQIVFNYETRGGFLHLPLGIIHDILSEYYEGYTIFFDLIYFDDGGGRLDVEIRQIKNTQ